MAKVGAVSVVVTARTSAFQKKMRRAAKRMRVFGKAALRATKRIAKFGVGLGAVAAGGLALLTKQSLKNIDALAKTSDKLGITTEALAGMQLAAKLTGVEVRTMEMGLQRMTRRMAEAAKGGGEAKAVIKELGLDAVELTRLGPKEAILQLADAFAEGVVQGEKLRRAFKLFDSEGVGFVNTLRLGREGLEAVFAEAERFGLAISRIDAKQVENANDAIERAKSLITGLGNQLAVQLSGALKFSADNFVKWGTDGQTASSRVAEGILTVMGTIGEVANVVHQMRRGWLILKNNFVVGAAVMQAAVSKVGSVGMTAFADLSRHVGMAVAAMLAQLKPLAAFDPSGTIDTALKLAEAAATTVQSSIDTAATAADAAAKVAAMRVTTALQQYDAALKAFDAKGLPSQRLEELWIEITEAAKAAAAAMITAQDAFDPDAFKMPALRIPSKSATLQFAEGTAAGSAAAQRLFARADFAGSRNPAAKAVNGLRDDIRGYIQIIDERMEELIANKPVTISRGS